MSTTTGFLAAGFTEDHLDLQTPKYIATMRRGMPTPSPTPKPMARVVEEEEEEEEEETVFTDTVAVG